MRAPLIFGTRHITILFNKVVEYEIRSAIFNYMVELITSQLDTVFHALGDATRRQMLQRLAAGEQTVSELAAPFAISLAAASKHIKALESAGLLRREIRGRTHVCSLEPAPLASAAEWLNFYEAFWTGSLNTLEELLRAEDAQKTRKSKRKGEEK